MTIFIIKFGSVSFSLRGGGPKYCFTRQDGQVYGVVMQKPQISVK